LAHAVPEDAALARAHGLTLRPRPTASRAVPISVIQTVLPLLMRQRFVRRGFLGADSRMATEAVRAHFCHDDGCFEIISIDEDGPAFRAGLRAKDLIVSVQGDLLRPTARLDDVLLPFRPGETIQLGVIRTGHAMRVEVTLAGRR
jgi:S1-C subfamily serine protease